MADNGQKRFRKFCENGDWFLEHLGEIVDRFGECFVVVLNKRVLDHDKDFKPLLKRLKEVHGDPPGNYLEFATTKPLDMIL